MFLWMQSTVPKMTMTNYNDNGEIDNKLILMGAVF